MTETKKEIPDSMTLTLRHPVRIGEGPGAITVTELNLHEPTVDELDKFMKNLKRDSEISAMRQFMADNANVLPAVIGKIGTRDFNLANDYLSSFLSGAGTDPQQTTITS